jgi:hypothetical protein
MLGANKLQLETERVTVRDSTINFNTGSFTRAVKVRLSRPSLDSNVVIILLPSYFENFSLAPT